MPPVKPRPSESLHRRTLRIVIGAVAAMLLALILPLAWTWSRNVAAAETRELELHLGRALHRLHAEAKALHVTVHDYAVWDEMYTMLQDRDLSWADRNYVDTTFQTNRLNAVLFLDTEGAPFYAKAYHLAGDRPRRMPDGLIPLMASRTADEGGGTGLVALPEGPWMVAWHPVLPSERSASPLGLAVFARALDSSAVERFADDLLLDLRLFAPPPAPSLVPLDAERPAWKVDTRSANELSGSFTVLGFDGRPATSVAVGIERELHRKGRAALATMVGLLLLVGLAFGALVSWLLERLVLARVDALVAEVERVGVAGDAALRVSPGGNDELGGLARAINAMLDTLDTLGRGLARERNRTEQLLFNVLPHVIATRLMDDTDRIADAVPEATVVFADLVGFTQLTRSLPAHELVDLLDELFRRFDALAAEHRVEKVKTIGDAWMGVTGAPDPSPSHAADAARFALALVASVAEFAEARGLSLSVRVGLHAGPLVAGVIGQSRLGWDVWGDTVNTAARLESSGAPGRVHVSGQLAAMLASAYELEPRGALELKGLGALETAWLLRVRAPGAPQPGPTA